MKNLKTVWSDKQEYQFLKIMRKNLWTGKCLDFLHQILELQSCLSIADIGCGYGYLGSIILPVCSNKTTYTGVDENQELLDIGQKESEEWKSNRKTAFIKGDAYSLPLKDNHYDLVICQTLLMHLDKPETALSEMHRICKPGGKIVCIEPDNTFNGLCMMANGFLENIDHKDYAKLIQINLARYEGKRRLGLGDFSIGIHIPRYMNALGMKNISLYNSPQVSNLLLPQQYEIKPSSKQENPYNKNIIQEIKAGGGSRALIKAFKTMNKKYEELINKNKEDYQTGQYYLCNSYSALKITIGHK